MRTRKIISFFFRYRRITTWFLFYFEISSLPEVAALLEHITALDDLIFVNSVLPLRVCQYTFCRQSLFYLAYLRDLDHGTLQPFGWVRNFFLTFGSWYWSIGPDQLAILFIFFKNVLESQLELYSKETPYWTKFVHPLYKKIRNLHNSIWSWSLLLIWHHGQRF